MQQQQQQQQQQKVVFAFRVKNLNKKFAVKKIYQKMTNERQKQKII